MPKIVGATLAEHRQHVRERLFGALEGLMSERGFDSISLADIANRAGVGRTSVYNHFPDKESLLLAFIENETASFASDLRAALEGIDDPEEQLRVYVRQQLTLNHGYQLAPGPDLRTIVSRGTMARLREHVEEVAAILRQILEDGMRIGRLPQQDLNAVVPLVHACLTGSRLPPDGPGRDRVIDATTDFVLRGVGALTPVSTH